MDKIAVIMSVYNGDLPQNVELAIDSILNQRYKNYKLFIMIDGPVAQNILMILKKYEQEPAIEIYSRDINKGLATSLNELIDIIKSKNDFNFIARMDSDDESLPDRFCEQINYMQKAPDIDVVGSFCHEFGAEFALDIKRVPLEHEELKKYTLYKCPFIHPTVMFRISVFNDAQIRYPTNTKLSEDLALWFLLLSRGYKFANIDKVLLNYRIDDATLSRRSGVKKAFSEMNIRFLYSLKMKNFSVFIYSLILIRGVLALCPLKLKKIVYKKFR
ncbi:TPA: glycosyltransferase [Escherichia coli]|uniref:glycosyltransferase n=2 Tax=Escherichia coli TaxID=562 RepID=UPI0006A57BF8|nr:glycosyltransferase [Escherichia coli]EID2651789.1 glycosyltransferase [Escherichia coli]EKJ3286381.1 glycosyltransferase [Escherichia coli]ELO5051925.1 glycosyltransferase [Escherichia coli]MBE4821344.1 glycosyltransferase [Escherichia coli]MBZ9158506.1 glycosyltransferase [Escherichia coli]